MFFNEIFEYINYNSFKTRVSKIEDLIFQKLSLETNETT
jgi:hypothetical protein